MSLTCNQPTQQPPPPPPLFRAPIFQLEVGTQHPYPLPPPCDFFKVLDTVTMMTQWRNRVHRSAISNKINVEMPNGCMQPSSKMAPSIVLLYCHLWKKIKETTDLFTPFHRYLNKIKYAWSKYRKHTINSLFRNSAIDNQYQNVIPQTNVFLDQFSENTQLI